MLSSSTALINSVSQVKSLVERALSQASPHDPCKADAVSKHQNDSRPTQVGTLAEGALSGVSHQHYWLLRKLQVKHFSEFRRPGSRSLHTLQER
eukprot:483715-Amphidinium_carterae.1